HFVHGKKCREAQFAPASLPLFRLRSVTISLGAIAVAQKNSTTKKPPFSHKTREMGTLPGPVLCSPAYRIYVYRLGTTMKFTHPAVPFVGRLLIVYIFATSGIAKVFSWQANVQYVSTRHLPMVPVFLAVAAMIEIGGSICLITGYRAREA